MCPAAMTPTAARRRHGFGAERRRSRARGLSFADRDRRPGGGGGPRPVTEVSPWAVAGEDDQPAQRLLGRQSHGPIAKAHRRCPRPRGSVADVSVRGESPHRVRGAHGARCGALLREMPRSLRFRRVEGDGPGGAEADGHPGGGAVLGCRCGPQEYHQAFLLVLVEDRGAVRAHMPAPAQRSRSTPRRSGACGSLTVLLLVPGDGQADHAVDVGALTQRHLLRWHREAQGRESGE